MSEEEKKAIKGLEWSQQQMRLGNLPNYDQGHYADIRIVLNLIETQQKEIKKIKERIKGAIRFLEGCKTDSGTYVLFLSETEYLSEILKGE